MGIGEEEIKQQRDCLENCSNSGGNEGTIMIAMLMVEVAGYLLADGLREKALESRMTPKFGSDQLGEQCCQTLGWRNSFGGSGSDSIKKSRIWLWQS